MENEIETQEQAESPSVETEKSPPTASGNAINRAIQELKEASAQLRTAVSHCEAQVKHLTDFVVSLCRAEGMRIPEAFTPKTAEGKTKAESKVKPGGAK